MRAAIISTPGQPPQLAEIPIPTPGPGERLVQVRAAAISHLVKARSSGTHYTAEPKLPIGVGMDGVGRLEDGRRIYFAMPSAPHGSMAEWTVVDERFCVSIPEGLDDPIAAAIANPAMSSWAALAERAKLQAGETVLVNGATGTSGQLAVQIARLLGAGRIVATGRNRCALEEVQSLGADMVIQLGDHMDELQHHVADEFSNGVDVVLDYLWGPSAENLLIAAARAGRDAIAMRFVQIGSMSAADITLAASVLRASAIELMGSGGGSIALPRLIKVIGEVLEAAASDELRIAFKPAPFASFNQAWPQDDSTCRTVFVMNPEEA